MNIATVENVHSELSLKLISAIQDTRNWSEVLDWIIKFTGAKAAIITLRDKENCQIINDVDLEAKFHSPLIRGFSHEAIVHYMTNLRTIDPWAQFQRTHYPHRPVQMSKVCPTASIKETQFFDWLKSEGCEDTIVFELDHMAGYWTAINLFLETSTGKEAEQVLAFANSNYALLRSSWQTSQNMARAKQANTALLERAASGGAPVCLVGANGEMIECNALFRALIETDAVRLSGIRQKLSFGHSVSIHGLERWEQHKFMWHDSEADPILFLASPVDPDPLFADKREQLWLLTCSISGTAKVAPSIGDSFNLGALTRQERELYEGISSGQSVPDAGSAIGLKRTRAFEVWSSVREKLGISSAHKLRA